MRLLILTLLLLPGGVALAQPAPSFDAASIKPSTEHPLPNFRVTPGRLTVKSVSLRDLILRAYGMQGFQLSGTPGWMESDGFAIEASAGTALSVDQMNEMLRALLVERFQLKIHSENRNTAVFALKEAPGGSRMARPADGEGRGQFEQLSPDRIVMPVADSVPALVAFLNSRTGAASLARPVVDRTRLTGNFKIRLEYDFTTNPDGRGGRMEIDYPSALPRQLGLKLEPDRADIVFWIVDSAQKPTAN